MRIERFIEMINTGKCSKLRIERTRDFTVKDKHLDKILEALREQKNVRSIFLESNLSATGIKKLAQFLENNPQIKSFDLWNASFSFQKANDNIGYFTSVIQNNTSLKRLHLSGIGAANTDTRQFFEALKNNHSIETLSLYDNNFEATDVAQQIADLIATNTTLKHLKLGGHHFKAEELGIIARLLPSNTVLEELDVSANFTVKDESAILLANELAKDIHLKSIRLFNSEITARGAKALAQSLLTNSHLTSLDLGCNSIGKEGTLALANTLKKNRTLQELTIGAYSANNEGVTAFADMLEENPSLLKFDYNSFYTSGNGRDKLRIEIGLARNTVAFLKQQVGSAKELQEAEEKLLRKKTQYEQGIEPANFSDYANMRIQASRAGRSGCCAFGFFDIAEASTTTDSFQNQNASPK